MYSVVLHTTCIMDANTMNPDQTVTNGTVGYGYMMLTLNAAKGMKRKGNLIKILYYFHLVSKQ